MSINDNPHTVRYPYCSISYWVRDKHGSSVAAGVDDAWTHCDVSGLGSYPQFTFEASETYQRDRLLFFLQRAYEAGERDKAKAIRLILDIKP